MNKVTNMKSQMLLNLFEVIEKKCDEILLEDFIIIFNSLEIAKEILEKLIHTEKFKEYHDTL